MKYFKQMEAEFGIVNDIKVSALSKCPEVLTMEPVVKMKNRCGRFWRRGFQRLPRLLWKRE